VSNYTDDVARQLLAGAPTQEAAPGERYTKKLARVPVHITAFSTVTDALCAGEFIEPGPFCIPVVNAS